jgi:EmrB/QacA subfamily drug resistance transporter
MRKWIALIAVCLGSFMLLVDVTIVNVALPKMAVDLHASFTSLQWVIDIYAIALAALLLGAGALADRVGRKHVYLVGLVLFAISSLCAGLAPGTATLIVARGVQGIGAAAMFATTIALINASYEGRDRGIAFGAWGAVNGAAAAAGPIAGGVITQALSWRWIFFVNLPITVVTVLLSARALPREEGRRGPRIDVPGIATFTIGAAALTYALTRAPEVGWGSVETVSLLVLTVIAMAAFLLRQGTAANPIIELGLLRRPAFSGVMAGSLLLGVAAFAYLPFSSLWLQSVRDLSPIRAGLALVPLSFAALLGSLGIGRFLHGIPARWPITAGFALVGAGALLQAHLGPGSTAVSLLPGLIVAGLGVGLASPTIASAALEAAPSRQGGMAAGAVNTMRQLGYALGIAVLGAIAQARMGAVLSDHAVARSSRVASELVGGQAQALVHLAPVGQRDALSGAIHAAFASGLTSAMLVAGALGLFGAALVWLSVRPRAAVAGERLQPSTLPGGPPSEAMSAEK